MQLDRLTLGRMAKELGFVRDTLEKVCRLADVLKFMESDELLSEAIALKGGTAINLTIIDLPRLLKECEKCETLLLLIYTNYANSLDACGRVIEALRIYREAIEINPSFGMALGNYGRAYST